MTTVQEIEKIVADQIDKIPDPSRRAAIIDSLVRPERQQFRWQYGEQQFDCWVVALAPNHKLRIVYSTPPPIDPYPWCVVTADVQMLGRDDCWFASIDDAFINGWWDGSIPEDYEIA